MAGPELLIRTLNGNPSFVILHDGAKAKEPSIGIEKQRIPLTAEQALLPVKVLARMWADGEL